MIPVSEVSNLVNGKYYPLWQQFVDKKQEWIGGTLYEFAPYGLEDIQTEITDITLTPNGEDSAMFTIKGKDFDCAFDVQFGGISGKGEPGWITFSFIYSEGFRIKTKCLKEKLKNET